MKLSANPVRQNCQKHKRLAWAHTHTVHSIQYSTLVTAKNIQFWFRTLEVFSWLFKWFRVGRLHSMNIPSTWKFWRIELIDSNKKENREPETKFEKKQDFFEFPLLTCLDVQREKPFVLYLNSVSPLFSHHSRNYFIQRY